MLYPTSGGDLKAACRPFWHPQSCQKSFVYSIARARAVLVLPRHLGHRITRFLQFAYHAAETHEQELHILNLLSKSLSAELQFARYQTCFERLPFLKALLHSSEVSAQEGQVIQRLATQSLVVLDAGEDDTVFCCGANSEACYLAMHGSLAYESHGKLLEVHSHQWISEMCLWTEWSHVGDLTATSFSKILAIHFQGFCTCVASLGAAQIQAHHYALSYLETMNQTQDLSDLWLFEKPSASREHPDLSTHMLGQLFTTRFWTERLVTRTHSVRLARVAPER